MKVVLLAAGRSFRAKPIEDKNFLSFSGKILIEHQFENLLRTGFNEILVIAGAHNLAGLSNAISSFLKLRKSFFKAASKKTRIEILEQKNLDDGMAGALLTAESWVKNDPFVVVSSNDVLDMSAYACIKKSSNANHGLKNYGLLLAKKVTSYFPGGYLKIDKSCIISEIIEKPLKGSEPSDLVNIVMHYHPQSEDLFKALHATSSKRDDRYEQALQSLFTAGFKYRAVTYNGFWQPIKYPWHVLDVMEYFLPRTSKIVRGKKVIIAKTAVISGPVVLADGVRVFDNAVIIGPAYVGKNSVVATNAMIRGSSIGANCVIGFGSEITRSFLGDNVWTHTNYIGDSVIGSNVSFGSGTVTGNLRLDEEKITVVIGDEKINTERTKLGLMSGDAIRIGINTSFMPGIKIGSHSLIGAGITIGEDIPEKSFVRGSHTLKISPNHKKIQKRDMHL